MDTGYYIDGFVFPIRRDRLNEYGRLAEAVAEIWKGISRRCTRIKKPTL
jgi:uncharacterized protein YbaA (DUF1428 family)